MMNVLVVLRVIHIVCCVCLYSMNMCVGRMVSIEASLYVHLGRRSDLGHRCLAVSCFYISMYRYVIHILVIYNVYCTIVHPNAHFNPFYKYYMYILVLLPMFILSVPRRSNHNQLTIYIVLVVVFQPL